MLGSYKVLRKGITTQRWTPYVPVLGVMTHPAGGYAAPWSASYAGREASRTLAEGSVKGKKGERRRSALRLVEVFATRAM